jgi:hypothetical protein
MAEKCKSCGGTGWRTFDLKSDDMHSKLIAMGIDCEVACTDCDAGRAEVAKAKAKATKQSRTC